MVVYSHTHSHTQIRMGLLIGNQTPRLNFLPTVAVRWFGAQTNSDRTQVIYDTT
jgi:hypothetical protein